MPTTLSSYRPNRSRNYDEAGARAARFVAKKAYDYAMSTPGKPKKYTRKGLRGTQNKVENLTKQVRNMKVSLNNDVALHTHRNTFGGSATSVANKQLVQSIGANDIVTMDQALSSLRFFDITTPSTLVTASGVTGTFSRKMLIKNVNFRVRYQNNYQIPLIATFYVCSPKKDTGIAPSTAWDNGMTDQSVGTHTGSTEIFSYPTDSDQFNQLWKIQKTIHKTLQPGQFYEVVHNTGPYSYNPAVTDSHNLRYQKALKSVVVMHKFHGVTSHSAFPDVGISDAGIDWTAVRTTKVEYEANIALNDYSVTNGLGTYSGTPLVSNKPVSDNQSRTAL